LTKQVAEGCENRDLMDHMLFADSTLLYARNEMIVLRYQDCLSRLKANRNNPDITMHAAVHDYHRAIDVFKECCFQTDLSTVMMCGDGQPSSNGS
jgi:hypothetical protein